MDPIGYVRRESVKIRNESMHSLDDMGGKINPVYEEDEEDDSSIH